MGGGENIGRGNKILQGKNLRNTPKFKSKSIIAAVALAPSWQKVVSVQDRDARVHAIRPAAGSARACTHIELLLDRTLLPITAPKVTVSRTRHCAARRPRERSANGPLQHTTLITSLAFTPRLASLLRNAATAARGWV